MTGPAVERSAARTRLELPAPARGRGRSGKAVSPLGRPAGAQAELAATASTSPEPKSSHRREPAVGASLGRKSPQDPHVLPEVRPAAGPLRATRASVLAAAPGRLMALLRREPAVGVACRQGAAQDGHVLPEVRPAAGALRATRGIVLAAASAAIALAGHVLGGGHAPSVPALLVVAGLVGAGFVVLADRRRGFSQILIGALASQPVFHIAFSLAEQHGPADPHAARPTPDQLAVLSQQTTAADLMHQLQAALDPAMVAGHVLAAVGIAALTAHGENLLWSLFELVARATAPILQPVPIWTTAPAAQRAAASFLTPPRRQHLARVRTRRGPPAVFG